MALHLVKLADSNRAEEPGVLPDPDDTARAMICISLLNKETQPENLISYFYNGSYFVTYKGERNPSISTNCNVLLTLLSLPNPDQYAVQISSVITYLCSAWDHGQFRDKWVSWNDRALDLADFLERVETLSIDATCPSLYSSVH